MKRYMFAFLLCLTTCLLASPAYAARLVTMGIYLDGVVILESSTSDNGHPDADAVWEYLKSSKFKATEHFQKLNVATDAKETVLTSDAPIGGLDTIIVIIGHGGMATTHKLKLIRGPIDTRGREWSLDDAEVDRLFSNRFIRRGDAARLENPRNYKGLLVGALVAVGIVMVIGVVVQRLLCNRTYTDPGSFNRPFRQQTPQSLAVRADEA